MTRLTEPTRTGLAVLAAVEADAAELRARRRSAGPAACAQAEVDDLAALRARRAFVRRVTRLVVAAHYAGELDIADVSDTSRRAHAYADRRWPLSGLCRRDYLDRRLELEATP